MMMKNVKEELDLEGPRHGKEKATWERFYGRWVVCRCWGAEWRRRVMISHYNRQVREKSFPLFVRRVVFMQINRFSAYLVHKTSRNRQNGDEDCSSVSRRI